VTEPVWLDRRWVDALHFHQLSRFGGLHGVRDGDAIASALARPRNQWEYGTDADLASVAAAYAFGLVRNHGYIDGNKRIGFVAMAVFLELNGVELVADEDDVVTVMVALAAGELDEAALAEWVRGHTPPLPPAAEL
jgi:death on curing protein